jgi:predicted permease
VNLRSFAQRLLALTRSRRLDRELDDEVQAHLELAERDALAAGLSPADARAAARRSFGGVEQMKEEHRDHRSARWLDTLLKDVRYGLLLLARDPGFAAVAVGVMAIGIGANAAMFSLVDAVLLKPLPYSEPDRIVRVWEAPTPTSRNGIATLNLVDWKRLSTSFEALSATRGLNVALTGRGDPSRLGGMLVSADYFAVFGVKALVGRTFAPQEDQPGAAPVVVLSYAAWQTHFGGDRSIVNRDVMLDGEPHQVVGILPAGVFEREDARFWKPLVFTPEQRTRSYHWLGAVGRLKAGISLEQAQQEMRAVSASLTELQPPFKKTWSVAVEPFDQTLVGDSLRRSIYVAFGAVVMVLLIACANIANLLLAKGVTRSKEMAVRSALGASRGRLVAQMLTESLVLCLVGGVAGVGLAYLLIEAAVPLLAPSLPPTANVGLDLRVLGFAAAVAVGVSLVVGLLPSLQTSSGRLSQALNRAARGSSGSREGVRRTIVVAEVAVSLVLICGAVLMFKSLLKLQRVDAGVRIDNVITMSADLSLTAYPDAERATRFIDAVSERLRAVPGVERVAVSTDVPLRGVRQGDAIGVPGKEDTIGARFKRVDPRYFDTLDIPVLSGRGFSDRDRAGAPRVVMVNEALAARLAERFGMRDPVGQAARLNAPAYESRGQLGKPESVEIVGVIRNERVQDLQTPVPEVVYMALAQAPRREIKFIVRTRGDEAAVMPGIREAVRQVDPHLPLGDVRTMKEIRERSLSGASDPTWVIGVFAGIAALLAALGLYGVLSHAVNQQRREIGIRMALGARAEDVLTQVLRQAFGMIAVGLAAGLLGAFAVTRVMRTLLFEVSALDPVALTTAGMAMALVGLLAALVPASRASRVNPVTALRSEG